MALVILYILCEDTRIFYWLRDNFIEDEKPNWLIRFHKLPEIAMVIKMIDLKNQPTVEVCKQQWDKILSSEEFEMITMDRLKFVPEDVLKDQLAYSDLNESDSKKGTLRDYHTHQFSKFRSNEADQDNSTNFGEVSIKEK